MSAETAILVQPDVRYRESFLDALAEYHRENRHTELSATDLRESFVGYVATLRAQDNPVRVSPDLVPQTTFWLVDHDVYVGRLSLRHTLNESLRRIGGHIGYDIRPSFRRQKYGTVALRLGLDQARRIGLHRVLVTCNAANIGSRGIIEVNGGILGDDFAAAGRERPTCHYWIDLWPSV